MIINRSDCIANFQFEESVTNSTGGTNGTVTGTAQYADSVSGKGFDFDGSTRIEIGNSTLSNSSDLSIFFKMNLDTHTAGDRMLAKRTTGNTNGFLLSMNNPAADEWKFFVRNAADSAWVTASINVAETIPYAIRLEINLTNEITISYYTSAGVLTEAATAFPNSTYASNSDNITIGDFTGGNNAIDGVLDDFTICTSILTNNDFYSYYMGFGLPNL